MTPSSNPLYYVRSDSDPTVFYMVTTDARGLLHCECKSSQYRRTPCKHQRQVYEGTVRPATPKTQPLPAVMPVRVLRSREEVDLLYGVAS